jgi:hypothetical protein
MKRRLIHDLKIFLMVLIAFTLYGVILIPIFRYSDTFSPAIQASLIGVGIALITGILALLKDFIL